MNVEAPSFVPVVPLSERPTRPFGETVARSILAEVWMDADSFGPELLTYMVHLGSHSETMDDEERARGYTAAIAEAQREIPEPERLTAADWAHVDRASTFTDIGKAGPFAKTIGTPQWLVTRLYAERKAFSPAASLETFVRDWFEEEADRMLAAIPSVPGLSAYMPMRAFWDMHSQWSYDILKAVGMSRDITLSAAAHHVLEGETAIPRDGGMPIVNLETGRFQALGVDRPLDAREAMVILIDKYDANMARSGATHDGAIAWLRDFLRRNPVLARLPQWKTLFERCLEDLDRSRAGERDRDESGGRMAA